MSALKKFSHVYWSFKEKETNNSQPLSSTGPRLGSFYDLVVIEYDVCV